MNGSLRQHYRCAVRYHSRALSFLQIGIALAAITVLTRRRWLLWGAAGPALVGIAEAVTAFVT